MRQPALRARSKMLICIGAYVISMFMFWDKILPGSVMLAATLSCGIYLYFFVRCPNCRSPYLLQKGKSVLKLGETCSVCGEPVH